MATHRFVRRDRSATLTGRALAEDLGEQVTLVEVEGARHALLPEQQEAVTAALLEFYAR